VKFLVDLQKEGIKVSFHNQVFKLNGETFESGTLIIGRGENVHTDFDEKVTRIANLNQIQLSSTKTGFVDEGLDFGSSHVQPISPKKVGLLIGDNASSLSVGEVWHFFEQQLNSKIHLFWESDLESVLNEINTLILPEGNYDLLNNEVLKDWIEKGGNLIVLGTAASIFSSNEFDYFGIKRVEHQDTTIEKVRFGDIERNDISGVITGAIFRCDLDKTFPLTYGIDRYETLRQNADVYSLTNGVYGVKLAKKALSLNGFVGSEVKEKQSEALIAGFHAIGSGNVIYFIDNPLFRSFWERGKLLFSNAVYLIGN
jgi:hypothetical protein